MSKPSDMEEPVNARMLDSQYQLIRSLSQFRENHQTPVLLAYDHVEVKYVAIKGAVDIFASISKAKRILRELKFSVRLSGHPDLIYLDNLLVPSSETAFTGLFMVFEHMRCDLTARLAEGVAAAQAEAEAISQNKGRGYGQRVGKPITGRQVKRWMFELLTGLAFMHGSGVLHRDIKPANLLLDDKDRLRICDLGLARADIRQNEDFAYLWTSHVVSRSYRAPELFLSRDVSQVVLRRASPPTSPRPSYSDASPESVLPGTPLPAGTPPAPYPPFSCYSSAIDVWSVGAVFAETLTGRVLFPPTLSAPEHLQVVLAFSGTPKQPDWAAGGTVSSPSMRQYLEKLPFYPGLDKKGAFPGVSAQGTDLLDQLLAFDPRERPSADQALRHAYFDSVRGEYVNRPAPVKLDPRDWEFELRPASATEPATLRREMVAEIKAFRERAGKLPGSSAGPPPLQRRPLSSARTLPAVSTHDGQARSEKERALLQRGQTMPTERMGAMHLGDSEPEAGPAPSV